MPDFIRDGKGRGYLAGVNSKNQLVTRSTSVEQRLKSTVDEAYYEVTTGEFTLTTANESGSIYLKNTITDGKTMVIDRVFYDLWESTGGDANGGTLKYYRNPTVTGGSAIIPYNTNFGSVGAATGTFLKTTTTMTGDVWWTAYISPLSSNALEEGRILLPQNASFGISFAAPTGNTSLNVSINIGFYYFDTSLVD